MDNERGIATGWLDGELSPGGTRERGRGLVGAPFEWQAGWTYLFRR